KGTAVLTRPVAADHYGFVLAPMSRGIRLTSGAEFARHDAKSTPVQLARAEPHARGLFPLGESVDKEAWMGARPVFPDLRPAIGKAPGLDGVWLNFGHAHHGLTLGPATGLLLAQMMSGAEPFTDASPYSAARFART
ncbi:MAG TPA: FAD-binding oxidoreductase, partial [Rhizobiaceae bacterium]|nr:FAD-binding oxidoreductase [Rhizobiaceae bacterium]